jgi:hypothetical protein
LILSENEKFMPLRFLFDQTDRFSGQRLRSYETTPKWHGFLMIKLAALAAGGWADT